MNISKMTSIYYRGYAKDCNYSCSYCIFATNKMRSTEKDKKYLEKFVEFIEKTKFEKKVSIMFTPYGEALTKKYYFEAIKKLTQHKDVETVSCQTNGSFKNENFLNYFTEKELEKISLWISFHPEMISAKNFAEKINFLNQKIKISVGAVGIEKNRNILENLKNLLDENIYFWINKPEGKVNENFDFSYIDPNYFLEEKNYKCDVTKCQSGEKSLFVKEDGKTYLCHTSKISCGNLYGDDEIVRKESGRCNCYLTYSNRYDINFPFFIHRQQRYFKYKIPKAIFFDIDGTLVTKEKNYIEYLKNISKNIKIYFLTGRDYKNVLKTFPLVKNISTEGVFSYGAHIKLNQDEIINYLDEKNKIIKKSFTGRLNHKEKNLNHIEENFFEKEILKKKFILKFFNENKKILENDFQILEEDGIFHLINKNISKLKAVQKICEIMNYERDEIFVVGNGKHDAETLKFYPSSFAVLDSDEEAKKSASEVISIEDIFNLLKIYKF